MQALMAAVTMAALGSPPIHVCAAIVARQAVWQLTFSFFPGCESSFWRHCMPTSPSVPQLGQAW